jgi:hypothetical protein
VWFWSFENQGDSVTQVVSDDPEELKKRFIHTGTTNRLSELIAQHTANNDS